MPHACSKDIREAFSRILFVRRVYPPGIDTISDVEMSDSRRVYPLECFPLFTEYSGCIHPTQNDDKKMKWIFQ